MDPLLHDDKLRGALVGIACGEALGRPAQGLPRDTVLRRHGRLVRLEEGATGGGALAAAALAVCERWRPGDEPDEELRAAVGGGGTGALLAGAAVAALLAAPDLAGGARAARELARGLAGDDDAVEAAGLLGAVQALAFASSPWRRLPADETLAALRDECRSGASRDALDPLREQALSPPSPDEAEAPFEGLAPALRLALLAVHALLVRPRSAEAAVVYAVNLGGEASALGALVGCVAGAHRGLACLPERWFRPLAETEALVGAARRLSARRRGAAPTG